MSPEHSALKGLPTKAIIIGMNCKELTKSKVYKKKLPQLKKYFSSFIKIETKL